MKAILKNREDAMEVGLNPTGYHADRIVLEAADVRGMVTMLNRDPEHFRAWLWQLEARFPENRVRG